MRRKAAAGKQAKPRSNFPLFPHASGKWAKTIRGKTYYFGRWDDPHGAESEYLAVAEDLHAGREPRRQSDATGITLRQACNRFMKMKRVAMESNKLSARTFVDYDRACQLLIETFGRHRQVAHLAVSDFEKLYPKLSATRSATSLGGQVTMIRSVFKYAYEADLIDKPVKFGPSFKSPSKTDHRKAKAIAKIKHGARTFSAEDLRQLIEATRSIQFKAMLLLGINGGLGNTDIANLPMSALDLKTGWLDYPRQKTGVERRIPLWPETVEALEEVRDHRQEPADFEDEGVLFLTRLRQRWVRYDLLESKSYGKLTVKPRQCDAIAQEAGKMLRTLDMKRKGLSFYSLRHTFETIAGEPADQVAVDAIMGHVDSSMAANYRHDISDERLRRVTAHVRQWLFADQFDDSEGDTADTSRPTLRVVG